MGAACRSARPPLGRGRLNPLHVGHFSMTMTSATMRRPLFTHAAGMVSYIRSQLPEGRSLPADIWRRRHHGIVVLLWLQAVALVAAAIVARYGIAHGLADALPVAL